MLFRSVYIGTTDEPFEQSPEKAVATPPEIDYLVAMVNEIFPGAGLSTDDVAMHCCGVRPLPHVDASTPSSITRRHAIVENDAEAAPILTLVGGKLTTCRSLGEEAADRILKKLGRARRYSSRERVIPGGEDYPGTPALLLRERSGLPELGAAITLEKRIPIGAGLAGGSSDGAAALVGLNALWGCGFSREQLLAMAAALGSDMPFCLEGGSRLCFGRGELMEPAFAEASSPPPPFGVLLIKDPSVSVSTPWAFSRCRDLRGDFYLEREADFEQRRQALRQSALLRALATGDRLPPLRNDLQAVVEPEQPSVRRGLNLLRGASEVMAVAMSGSGPSLFALFPSPAEAERARQDLAEDLDSLGMQTWCCRFLAVGASLEEP